jgi:hypothetical protein
VTTVQVVLLALALLVLGGLLGGRRIVVTRPGHHRE